MPLWRYALYEKGIQIWCAPTADARDQWASTMTHIALEGRVFVISCCQYAERKDYPDDYPAYQGESTGKGAVMIHERRPLTTKLALRNTARSHRYTWRIYDRLAPWSSPSWPALQ